MEQAADTARLLNDKAYKVAADQESMAFWKKQTGDYFRYAYEACVVIMDIKADPIMEAAERKAVEEQEAADLRKAMEDGSKTYQQLAAERRELEDGGVAQARYQTLQDLEPVMEDYRQKALKCYSFAQLKADKGLISANPTRLSVALNFGVFTWDCMGEKESAVALLKKAVDVGQKTLDKIDAEEEQHDALTLLDLMKENIEMWEEELLEIENARKAEADAEKEAAND